MVEYPGMMTYQGFDEIPVGRHVVSIGTFDGVHLGHQHLLRTARERAEELGVPLLAVTFEPPPSQVIRPESFPGRLVTAEQKLDLLARLEVSATLVLEFTETLMMMSPEAFLQRLAAAAHPVELWIGEEFALGYNRAGDVKRLTAIGVDLGFTVTAVARVEMAGEIVSSSRIRNLVKAGEANAAHDLLGHPFRIAGEVVEGAKVGRTIGYPTANVEPPRDLVALPDGIYASLAGLPGEPVTRPAMTYIGTRPALNSGSRLIETHLLDFSGDLYAMTLATDILERIRPDATFASVDHLVSQLREDERLTRRILSARADAALEVAR